MDDKELEEKVRTMGFSSGKNTMTLDDMATIQPGLARIMPEIGARTWKLYYAAKAQNWPMAKFQYKEIIGPRATLNWLPHKDHFPFNGTGAHLIAYRRREWMKDLPDA